MPRLRNASGVVVSVDDATAARLGAGWESADGPKSEEPKPAKRGPGRPRKSKSDEE